MNLKNSVFIIYGKEGCPHCVRAKEFAKANGLEYGYLTLGKNYTKDELFEQCAPIIPTTVPRIFLDTDSSTEYIGTCDEFIAFVHANSKGL